MSYPLKRLLDVSLGTLLVVMASPLFLLAFILTLLDGHNPFFTQARLGLHCRTFTIFKFRTMKDAPLSANHIQPDAPELTPIGRFLRNTSLDELPQLLNVLKGDMSLIGPRPHTPTHAKVYAAAAPRYYERYAVKPGLIGLVQVTPLRYLADTESHIRTRVSADLYYIHHISLKLDIKILSKAVPCVLLPRLSYQLGANFSQHPIRISPPAQTNAPAVQVKSFTA